MRLTSALFVAAHIRRCYSEGATAVVTRRGADEAGAMFFIVDRLDNTADLYGPAPQTAFGDIARPSGRLFQRIADHADPADIDARLKREAQFDPDIWIVAIEDREGRSFLDLAPA
jgi:hypothetical protein